jgi:predicted phage terminase large subunit-like protein
VEQVAFQLAAIQDLQRCPEIVGHWVQPVKPDKDKLARAMVWASRAKQGFVHLVAGPWNHDWLNEVCDFPQVAHDDMTDSTSIGVQLLARTGSPQIFVIG